MLLRLLIAGYETLLSLPYRQLPEYLRDPVIIALIGALALVYTLVFILTASARRRLL